MKRIAILLSTIIAINFSVLAQQAHTNWCGTVSMHEQIIQQMDPAELQAREALMESIYANSHVRAEKPSRDAKNINQPDYIIPVVFHIMHNNGPENIPDSWIINAVDILNEDFRKRGPDVALVSPAFAPIHADSKIEFRLAKIDPQGNFTTGWTRNLSQNAFNANENVKGEIMWPHTKYLNIWVAGDLSSADVGGYAIFPTGANASNDGIVINHTYVGRPNMNIRDRRTLSHEVGHSLGLRHTWGPSNTPGLASNCNGDDGIADTPNTIGTFGCNLASNTCGSLDNVENIMDYSSCFRMFTQGQATIMDIVLSSISFRISLVSPANLTATGTAPGQIVPCVPFVTYDNEYRDAKVGDSIQVSSSVALLPGCPTFTQSWEFQGPTVVTAAGASTKVAFPTVGVYNTLAKANNSLRGDTAVLIDGVRVHPATPVVTLPLIQPFDNNPISNDPALIPFAFDSRSPTADPTWRHVVHTSGEFIQHRTTLLPRGERAIFTTPNINTSALAPGEPFVVSFRWAARPASNQNEDELILKYSRDGGRTFSTLRTFTKGNAQTPLYTHSLNGGLGEWYPSAAEWRTHTQSIANVNSTGEMMIRFEVLSDGGNRIYIDDLRLGSPVSVSNNALVSTVENVEVYPNPFTADANIVLNMIEPANLTISIMDLAGRNLGSKEVQFNPGVNKITTAEIAPQMSAGMYVIRVSNGSASQSYRLVKQQ